MRPLYCFLLLTLLWAAMYLPALGSRELHGEEARRVLPGRTMIQSGEWIVPRSGGEIYNRKPPLVNWMSAAAIKLTGRMDEWTVRATSVLMMLALVLSMFQGLRGWLGTDKALLAALITLANIGFIEKGRLIEIEALYYSLFGIALVLWLGLRWKNHDLAAWITSGIFLGLGFLAKGPPHLLYFYVLILCVLLAEKRVRDLLHWKHLAGLAVSCAIFVPWGLMNSARNPLKNSSAVWQEQITHRLGFGEFDLVNYLLQVPQSLVNFLPWAILLPLCWRSDVVTTWQNSGRHGQWMLGLRRGLLWAFFLIALLPSSRPRFLLPLNVAAAILVADALTCMSAEWLSQWGRRWRLTMAGVAAISVLALLVGLVEHSLKFSTHLLEVVVCVLWITASLFILKWLWRRTDPDRALTFGKSTAFAMSALAGAFMLTVVPHLLHREKLRPFAAQIIKHTGPTDPILLYQVHEQMWPFYLGLRCYEMVRLSDIPRDKTFRWVMVSKLTWTKESERSALLQQLGPMVSETPLIDPARKAEYVLVQLKER